MRVAPFAWLAFACGLQAQIVGLSVTTGASFSPGLARPGGISTLFCRGLVNISGVATAAEPLPTRLADVSVIINGVAAPLLAVADLGGYQQVNFIVPQLPDMTRLPISVTVTQYGAGASIKLTTNAFAAYPADIFRDGSGLAAAQHASDFSAVTSGNPARSGETIILYATGMGAVEPPVAANRSGKADDLSQLVLYPGETAPQLFFCSVDSDCGAGARVAANASFAGLAPGLPGVYQLNAKIPDGLTAGTVRVGVQRYYCYDAPCTLQSPFAQLFSSDTVKLNVQ